MTEATTIDEFRKALYSSGQDFIYNGEQAAGCARIRFTGTYQGTTVVWDVTVMTLAFYNAHQARNNKPAAHRQFIDIAQTDNTLRKIEIGLELEIIDTPTLLKTMVMVRKYKRLRAGRREFGGTGRQE